MAGKLIAIVKHWGQCCLPMEVIVSKYLEGTHRPILSGNKLFVSPAMYELLSQADEEEMELLLRSLNPLEIPDFADTFKTPREMPLHVFPARNPL